MAGGVTGPGPQPQGFGTRANGSLNAAIRTFGSCYVLAGAGENLDTQISIRLVTGRWARGNEI